MSGWTDTLIWKIAWKSLGTAALIIILGISSFAWRSPKTLPAKPFNPDSYALMSWADYAKISRDITPPVVLNVDPYNKGAVKFVGTIHTNDISDPQFELLRQEWDSMKPDVALIEGRLGFLVYPFMDPTKHLGEPGFVAQMAKNQSQAQLYSWELSKADEIANLKQVFTREQVALLIILRPFLSQTDRSSEKAQAYIDERGDRPGIEGAITTVADIDRIWARDFPDDDDWRDLPTFGPGLPGYMQTLFETANDVRDHHMLNIVDEFTQKGHRVFVTAGWSHIVRVRPVFESIN